MKMYFSLVAIVWAVLIHHISCQTTTRSLKIASSAKISQIYVDGSAVTGVSFGASWSRSTIFTVPGSSRVLAVKFDSSTRPDAFIIADGSTSCGYFTSPATVKCVTASSVSRVTNSWYLNTFIDSMWPSASVSSTASKVLVYPTRQFCQQANWMWTAYPASVIYCRIRITPSVICPALSLPNSMLNTTVTSFTTAVRVQCNEGYTIDRRNPLTNSIDTVCTRNGTWSPFPISCQLILCRTLNLLNSVWNTTIVSFATAVQVRCNEGYALDPTNLSNNSFETVCARDGNWSPFPISCQPILCPVLNVTNYVLNTSFASVATAVRVSCKEGYALDPTNPSNNSFETVCTRYGNWSTFLISCQLIRCPTLNVTNTVLNTSVTSFATAVQVRCNSGYAIDPTNPSNNSIDTVCTRDGNWSTFQISCQIIGVLLSTQSREDSSGVTALIYTFSEYQDSYLQIAFGGNNGGLSWNTASPFAFVEMVSSRPCRAFTLLYGSPLLQFEDSNFLYFIAFGGYLFEICPAASISQTYAGNILVACSVPNSVREYTAGPRILREKSFNNDNLVFFVTEASDGVWLISFGQANQPAKVVKMYTNGTIIASTNPGMGLDSPRQLVVSASGYILVANENDGNIYLLNPTLTDSRILPLPPALTRPRTIAFAESQHTLYVGETTTPAKVHMFINIPDIETFFT